MSNPRITITREQLWRMADGFPVQVSTPHGMLELQSGDEAWVPLWKLNPVPPHMVENHRRHNLPTEGMEVWTNDVYEVIVLRFTGEFAGVPMELKHLSIKRLDRAPIRNWRHFQQMKNEVCGDEWEALELFPAESRLADNANQYHLWALPQRLPFGFPEGLVLNDDEIEAYNRAPHSGRQEPMQEGLTTGRKLREQGGGDKAAPWTQGGSK